LKLRISHRRWYGDVFKVVEVVKVLFKEIRIQIIGNGVDSHSQALLWKHNRKNKIIYKKSKFGHALNSIQRNV
jgi:hypothetical protein